MRFISYLTSIRLTVAMLAASVMVPLALPAVALAAAPNTDAVCQGVTLTGGTCSNDATPISKTIKLVINILSIVAAVAAVIMIMVGGLRYVTSGGDSSKTASAKNTIIYSIIGLIVVALAQFLVKFVIARVGK
jgi:hypothetical protein